MHLILCCECAKKVNAKLVTGAVIYPHRPDLSKKKFYQCPDCLNYVGCHPGTDKSLGSIPSPELRNARLVLHRLIDPLWKGKKIKRSALYRRISDEMGRPYHNGQIRSLDEARKAYVIALKISRELSA